ALSSRHARAVTHLPEGLLVERVWLVEATYAPDAAETRVPFRAEHIASLAARKDAGLYVQRAACPAVSSSLILVRAASEAEALAIVGDDVYLRNGVWVELRARLFGRVARASEIPGAAGG